MHQGLAVCLLASQSINQSASQPDQQRRQSVFVKAYTCYIKVVACSGEGRGFTLIFSSYVGLGPASTVHTPKHQEFQAPQKYLKF